MNRVRFLLLFFLALSLATAHAQVSDLQFAATLGEELFQNSGATGMVLVIVRDNQVFFHGYGETAPGSHTLPTQDSVIRICSLTKIFTTDVLAKLAADKTVRLTDPLQRYAPPRTIVPRRVESRSILPITLEDLATHTSGLPRELGTAPRGTPHFTFPDRATRWRWLPNQKLKPTPGTVALYSNVAFDLLSDALASATHQQYAALLAERTLNPLHMRNTTYFPNAVQCSRLLQGFHDGGACTSTEQTAGSSGLYSTAGDMAIWLQYLLSDSTLAQDPSAQSVYLQPSNLIRQQGLDHAGVPSGIGLGWIHLLPADSPSHIIEKTGGGAGFQTYIAINHPHHTAIFLAATDGPGRQSQAISGSNAPNQEAPVPQTPHLNLFYGANNLLAAVAGFPPPPPPPIRKAKAKGTPIRKRAAQAHHRRQKRGRSEK